MIQIHCANHLEADTAWRLLAAVPNSVFTPVELHLNGFGFLYQVVRLDDGSQTAVRTAILPAHSSQA